MKVACQFRFKDGRVENHQVRPCRGEDLPREFTITVTTGEHETLFGPATTTTKHVFERRELKHPDIKRPQYYYEEV